MSHLSKNAFSRFLLLLLLLAGQLPASAQQTPSASSNQVAISFTVLDKKSKKFVTALRKEDVRIVEDGVPQIVTDLQQQPGKPLSIIIMLDMSVSLEKIIPVAKQVSREFVDSIIRPDKDSVGVVSFTHEAKFEQELTGDLRQVHQAIERLEFKPPLGYVSGLSVSNPSSVSKGQQLQGSTAIWDAISFASEKFNAPASGNLRRVVVIFTDGQDTSSKLTLDKAAKIALKSGVVVYSIGLGDPYYGGINEGLLRKISERTSGRAFFPEKVTEIQSAFAQIGEELLSQYLISYSSSNMKMDDKMRKIKIEIVNPELRKQGLQLSYRQGYFTGR